ncbi:MAG: hypothetical protein U0903_17570 [Planctomycetales bacterium]
MLERLIEQNYRNFLARVFGVKEGGRKRTPRRAQGWGEQSEVLEVRKVLSALNGLEGAVVAETATHHAKHTQKKLDKAAATPVTYPNVTGTWNVTVSAVVDGQSRGPYQGTVQVSQPPSHKRITGQVHLTGFEDFRITGKFDKNNLLHLNGKAHIPVDLGSFNLNIGVSLGLNYAADYQSFTGQGSRSIFGHDISVTMTGNKQNPA